MDPLNDAVTLIGLLSRIDELVRALGEQRIRTTEITIAMKEAAIEVGQISKMISDLGLVSSVRGRRAGRARRPVPETGNPDDELPLGRVGMIAGVTYLTVWRWVRTGQLPSRRQGRIYLVRRADLDAYLDSHRDTLGSK